MLLDVFASWCGVCRQELPQLKIAYAKYQNDPDVAFLLVSIDEDDKRLSRYLADMQFPFPVARLTAEVAEKQMGFDNVPATFYVDAGRRRPVLPERIRVAQRLANARELVHRSAENDESLIQPLTA